MYLGESVKSAISCLLSNKGRLALGVISVSVGISTLMGVMILSESQRICLKREIEKMGTNLMLVGPYNRPYEFTDRDVDRIKRCQGVLKIASTVSRNWYQVQYFSKILEGVLIVGWTPEVKGMINLSLKQGRFFTQQEVESRCNVGVIGKDAAYNLFKNKNPVGETIFILVKGRKVPVRIIGVLKEIGVLQKIMAGVENNGLILPLTYMREKIFPERLQGKLAECMVQIADTSIVKRVVQQIKKEFLLNKNFPCSIILQEEFIKYEYDILKRTTLIGLCIAIIFLIVGGIGIMTIMLKSVLERTREIGIRKAVGAKNRDILIQFLVEASIIGIIGCLVGILMGSVGTYLISGWLIKTGEMVISLQTIVISCSVAFSLTLLFGIYPALKAAFLNPIDALRYE